MAYSIDYRKRAVEYYREGHTDAEVTEAFKICPRTLYDWEVRYDGGDLSPQYPKTRAPRKLPLNELAAYVDAHPEDFQRKIGEHFKCSHQAVNKALAKIGYTNKKTEGYAERNEKEREEYQQKIADIPVSRRIYVDESGLSRFYSRDRGWGQRGKKIFGLVQGRRFARVNVIAGRCDDRILGECCYTCPITADIFENWFCDFLLPETKPGDTVIMDNASFHNKKRLRRYAAVYHVSIIFLPPYSPDYNPIEHVQNFSANIFSTALEKKAGTLGPI